MKKALEKDRKDAEDVVKREADAAREKLAALGFLCVVDGASVFQDSNAGELSITYELKTGLTRSSGKSAGALSQERRQENPPVPWLEIHRRTGHSGHAANDYYNRWRKALVEAENKGDGDSPIVDNAG